MSDPIKLTKINWNTRVTGFAEQTTHQVSVLGVFFATRSGPLMICIVSCFLFVQTAVICKSKHRVSFQLPVILLSWKQHNRCAPPPPLIRYRYTTDLWPRKPLTPHIISYQAWQDDSDHFEFYDSISVTNPKFDLQAHIALLLDIY